MRAEQTPCMLNENDSQTQTLGCDSVLGATTFNLAYVDALT